MITREDIEARIGEPAERSNVSVLWCYGAWVIERIPKSGIVVGTRPEYNIHGSVVGTRPDLKDRQTQTLITTIAELDAFLKEANWGGASLRDADPELESAINDEDTQDLSRKLWGAIPREDGHQPVKMTPVRIYLLYRELLEAFGLPNIESDAKRTTAAWSLSYNFPNSEGSFDILLDFDNIVVRGTSNIDGIVVDLSEEPTAQLESFTREHKRAEERLAEQLRYL